MEKAEDYLYKEHPASTLIFCPFLGENLSKILKKPTMIEQEILNKAIWIYNKEIFRKSILKEVYVPNFAEPVHRQINGVKKTFLDHLDNDGIHLSDSLRVKWAKKRVKLADRY